MKTQMKNQKELVEKFQNIENYPQSHYRKLISLSRLVRKQIISHNDGLTVNQALRNLYEKVNPAIKELCTENTWRERGYHPKADVKPWLFWHAPVTTDEKTYWPSFFVFDNTQVEPIKKGE